MSFLFYLCVFHTRAGLLTNLVTGECTWGGDWGVSLGERGVSLGERGVSIACTGGERGVSLVCIGGERGVLS